jgi:hypothetical protein
MGIELKWDALVEGLQVSFEAEDDHHRSVLPWSEVEKLRGQMEADLLSNIPQVAMGVVSDRDRNYFKTQDRSE